MIKLRTDLIHPGEGQDITTAFVKKQLQSAIELEHSTIPPYLTAYYSVKPEGNQEAAEIVRSVVIEEMLHMTLACNLLNAIGGSPAIDKPDFIPTYPGHLPGGVNQGLEVNLGPLSKDILKNVFMEIEEPEHPLDFESAPLLAKSFATKEYATIGAFYNAIEKNLEHLVELHGEKTVFCGDPALQIGEGFDGEAVAVVDLATAKQAIDTIVEQGEGTEFSPYDGEADDELAHYYKFAEIYEGRRLIKLPDSDHLPPEERWAYQGDPIPLSTEDVYPITCNATPESFEDGSTAYVKARQFSYTYTSLLKGLHRSFNGDPAHLNDAIGLMYSLRLQAQALVALELSDGKNAAPTFTYLPLLS